MAACGSAATRALAPIVSPAPSASDTAATAGLPKPVPQPITRTSPGAQVAWIWTYVRSGDGFTKRSLTGIGPGGAVEAQVDVTQGVVSWWRSSDGGLIFTLGTDKVTSYGAADGKLQRAYDRRPGGFAATALSPDGHWLAILLGGPPEIQLIDLRSGTSQRIPIQHDRNAALPGLSGQIASVIWGSLYFGDDPDRFYAVVDWGGPMRLTSFRIVGGRPEQIATALDGEAGRKLSSCAAPAMAGKVIGDKTLVTFCHMDGALAFFDLATLTSAAVVRPDQKNPFWLSPIFTPDGQLLYLHQSPGFGDAMQVVDLAGRRVLGPLPTPTRVSDPAPFSWLFPVAYAGWTASTMPVSPDGLKLYSATSDGVMVLRIPDLKPLAKLAPGMAADEVWISGDGRTVYATSGGKRLLVIAEDGSSVRTYTSPDEIGQFVSAERG